ncbi:MAG: BolA family protein [Steroidobacteraceae bacterium]
MSPDEISLKIESALPGATVRVGSDDGVHFSALVVAPQFSGLPALARHQLVYRALGGAVGGVIHALSLDTATPEEWARRAGG